jgi:hypothetical protein
MKKKKILKSLNKVLDGVTLKALSQDPSCLSVVTKTGVKVGDVSVKRNNGNADIYKGSKLIYAGIQEPNAIQGIVNRLSSNKKLNEVSNILRLEDEYVRINNDILFIKHKKKQVKDPNDKEIFEHRLLLLGDRLQDVRNKLMTHINI